MHVMKRKEQYVCHDVKRCMLDEKEEMDVGQGEKKEQPQNIYNLAANKARAAS